MTSVQMSQCVQMAHAPSSVTCACKTIFKTVCPLHFPHAQILHEKRVSCLNASCSSRAAIPLLNAHQLFRHIPLIIALNQGLSALSHVHNAAAKCMHAPETASEPACLQLCKYEAYVLHVCWQCNLEHTLAV